MNRNNKRIKVMLKWWVFTVQYAPGPWSLYKTDTSAFKGLK